MGDGHQTEVWPKNLGLNGKWSVATGLDFLDKHNLTG
jgi:hypothetical protein